MALPADRQNRAANYLRKMLAVAGRCRSPMCARDSVATATARSICRATLSASYASASTG